MQKNDLNKPNLSGRTVHWLKLSCGRKSVGEMVIHPRGRTDQSKDEASGILGGGACRKCVGSMIIMWMKSDIQEVWLTLLRFSQGESARR